jgi:hypothetical protein
MINTQGYITNLGAKAGGVPIIIAGKSSNAASSNQTGQGIVLQANHSQNNTFILNPNQTTLKMQGNIISQVCIESVNDKSISNNTCLISLSKLLYSGIKF